MEFVVKIKDINKLGLIDVTAIMSRLSWPDSGSSSSIQEELDKRYINVQPGPHPEMAIALIWWNENLIGWVGTRPWPEKFKGKKVIAQTVECFVDPDYRRMGMAKLGLQALITANKIDRADFVATYAPAAMKLAQACGCQIVLLCDA